MTEDAKPVSEKQKKDSSKKTKADMAAHGVKVEKKPSYMKFYLGGAGALLFLFILFMGLQPTKGSPNYGICRTYIELSVPYPHTLKFVDLVDRKLLVRVTYSYIDSYGQTIFFPITCKFARDENGKKFLESVDVNRDKSHPLEEQERIDEFNKSFGIGLFGKYEPNRIKPPKIPKKITDFKK